MVSVAIRPATTADLPYLAEVARAAGTRFAEVGLDLPEDDPMEILTAAELLLVAEIPDNGPAKGSGGGSASGPSDVRTVGFAAVVEVDAQAHLSEMSVHPDHMRRGIGGRLLEAACTAARERGYRAMTLTTFRDVPFNAPWYARRGFAVVPPERWEPELAERWKLEARASGEVAPRVAMRRPLTEPGPGES